MSNWYKKAAPKNMVRYMGTILAEVWVPEYSPDMEYSTVVEVLAGIAEKAERERGVKLIPQGDYQKVL